MRAAIEGPAKVGGATISHRLVQHLLNELGDEEDQLPILQHALMRTWAFWGEDHQAGEEIDLRHYDGTGGMQLAISNHADPLAIDIQRTESILDQAGALKNISGAQVAASKTPDPILIPVPQDPPAGK